MITIVKHKYIKILNLTSTTNFLKVNSTDFSKFGLFCLVGFSFVSFFYFETGSQYLELLGRILGFC